MSERNGWIGVDLDGTLAHYEGFKGANMIGDPIIPMLNRVKKWLEEGKDVRIFTARVWHGELLDHPNYASYSKRYRESNEARKAIIEWCIKHLGRALPVTNEKDYGMVELWDDRAVQIEPNTGRRMDEHVE